MPFFPAIRASGSWSHSSPPPAPRNSFLEVPPAPSRFVPLPAPGAWLRPWGPNSSLAGPAATAAACSFRSATRPRARLRSAATATSSTRSRGEPGVRARPPPGARCQLRLQPILRLLGSLVVPAGATDQSPFAPPCEQAKGPPTPEPRALSWTRDAGSATCRWVLIPGETSPCRSSERCKRSHVPPTAT